MEPNINGLRGMFESFFFFFSPSESFPDVMEVLCFFWDLPSGDVKLFRFTEGFSAKNFK